MNFRYNEIHSASLVLFVPPPERSGVYGPPVYSCLIPPIKATGMSNPCATGRAGEMRYFQGIR